MIRNIAASLNILMFVTFILVIFFDVNVKGYSKIILPMLVLLTPIINLYALETLNVTKLKSIIFSRKFKVFSISSLFLLVSLTGVLMTQGKDSDIYVIAFINLIERDDTYGGGLNPKKVYISKNISSEPFFNKTNGSLTDDIIMELEKYCKNNSIEAVFYDDTKPLKYNELGEVIGGGVRVEFGELSKILLFSEIDASIHIANMAAGGTTYTLYRWFGGWRLLSSKMAWIS